MRALIQRVSSAEVTISGHRIASISSGLVVLLGIAETDDETHGQYLVEKITNLRIFSDKEARFQYSALEVNAEILVVSQFTLYANTRRGRRPDFLDAAKPEIAEKLYKHVTRMLEDTGLKIRTGQFRAHMQVTLTNDGPVTLMVDSSDQRSPLY
ncbi:MAG: D-aminoacyl-tRNA deacylase [Chloroflexota bacterium]|nr:D-aminoacyl-tRNA deacylase [Chloroflexota bacterium]